MNYHSYRSSPIRNLDTSQAVKERFEDEFFQIRCTRLEKEKKQLEDEVNLLSSKIVDSSHKTEQILLLNSRIGHLIEQNQALRITIQRLSIPGTSTIQFHTKQILYHSRERVELEHQKQVDDLLRLYETAKAETLLFRKQNERLVNLYQLQKSRVSEVDDLDKAMEISKLKINITEIQGENKQLKEELNIQQKELQRLSKLYIYEKRMAEQKQKEHLLLLNQAKNNNDQKETIKYFSVQEGQTPIKNITSDFDYHSKELEQQLSILRKKLEEQNQVYQVAIGKYTELINQHQQVIKERDQLLQAAEYTLRQNTRENIVERPQKRQKNASGEIQRLKRQLKQKQEQIKSILTRFLPLTKIKQGQVSLEQDRKQRIEKHWKADIAILDVLLTKYKIQIF